MVRMIGPVVLRLPRTHVTRAASAVCMLHGVVSSPMHIDIVSNRTSRPAILLREAWREDGKVRRGQSDGRGHGSAGSGAAAGA